MNRSCDFFWGEDTIEVSFYTKKYFIMIYHSGKTAIFSESQKERNSSIPYSAPLLTVLPRKLQYNVTDETIDKYLLLL